MTHFFRGTLKVHGFLFDKIWPGEAESKQRILALWQPGCKIYDTDFGYVFLLDKPKHQHCQHAPGAPLCRLGDHLCNIPVSEEVRLKYPKQCFLISQQGELHAVDPGTPIQLGLWLDIDQYEVVPMHPLGPEPESPIGTIEDVIEAGYGQTKPSSQQEVEAHLQGLDDSASEPTSWFRRLVNKRKAARASSDPSQEEIRPSLPEHLTQKTRPAPFQEENNQPTDGSPKDNPPAELDHKGPSLEGLANDLDPYIQNLIELFRQRDWEQALQQAPPINNQRPPRADAGSGEAPETREDLGMSNQPTVDQPAYSNQEEPLEGLYQAAYQQLVESGEVEKAAFVSAELLNNHAHAVELLARHGRLQTAAELAEGYGMPPAMVVRLWFLAGNLRRALLLARSHEVFDEVLDLLEKEPADKVQEWRCVWANHLADKGDYYGAVELGREALADDPLLDQWINALLDDDGIVCGRVMGLVLCTMPEKWKALRPRVLLLINDGLETSAPARAQIAEAMLTHEPEPGRRPIARALLRALAEDVGQAWTHFNQWQRLLAHAQDGALEGETRFFRKPAPAPLKGLAARETPLLLTITERGNLPLYDGRLAANGTVLLALGEMGVHQREPSGTIRACFDTPANRLVMGQWGNRALALMERADYLSVARLDLNLGEANRWTDLRVDQFAELYDGSTWFVTQGNSLLGLDVRAESAKTLWRVSQLPAAVRLLHHDHHHLSLLMTDPLGERTHFWKYALPQKRLRIRRDSPQQDHPGHQYAIGPQGPMFTRVEEENGAKLLRLHLFSLFPENEKADLSFSLGEKQALAPIQSKKWLVLPMRTKDALELYLYDLDQLKHRATYRLAGAEQVRPTLTDSFLVVAVGLGYLVSFNLHDGHVHQIVHT